MEGQNNYAQYGAREQRLASDVRAPTSDDVRDPLWRPLDPATDDYLHKDVAEHEKLWRTVKDSREICLYYWRQEYWLRKRAI